MGVEGRVGERAEAYALILFKKRKKQKQKFGLVCFSSINLGFYGLWEKKNVPYCGDQVMLLFPFLNPGLPTKVDVGPHVPV